MTNDNGASRSGQAVKTVLAYRYSLMRHALARLLDDLGFGPVACSDSAGSLLREVSRVKPEIVVMEWDLLGEAEETITRLAAMLPRPVVVVLAPPDAQPQLQPALRAGTNGYLSYNITPEELADSLRLLTKGGLIVSGEVAGALADTESGHAVQEPSGGLSGREREVLGLIASGATNREIAQVLVVTENTVKVHLRNVLDKLHLRNRQQAAAFAVREGIVIDTRAVMDGGAKNA